MTYPSASLLANEIQRLQLKVQKRMKQEKFCIADTKIYPGESRQVYLEVASLYDYTKIRIPLVVVRGFRPGPTLFISAAVHGDEINGTEIIKRLHRKIYPKKISGTLILIPVVNVFGFTSRSRYLPDRRDLNRSFPGSADGSLAGRIAHIFLKEVVSKCTHGIDLHTAAIHRTNLPQIRACLDDFETRRIAKGFGVPVIMNSGLRDGSLREAARKEGVVSLLFEGGEALRFDEKVIKIGVRGCLRVMVEIGMLQKGDLIKTEREPEVYTARESYWVRAPHSGSFRTYCKLGKHVEAGERLAVISDLFGLNAVEVRADVAGIVIGSSTIPLVNQGDAMFHIAVFKNSKRVKQAIDSFDIEPEFN